jgi:hypothetical protein
LEQIEYIDSNFRETINSCITNLEFVNSFKEWVFNPDDMCEGGMGLTLNHNKVEGLRLKFDESPELQEGQASKTQSGR